MPTIDRRSLLAGAAATSVLAATGARADHHVSAKADLSGKSILITGTSSGFGRIGAELYARHGAMVFATMRGLPRPEADELRQLASDEQLDITVIELDVLDEAMVNSAVAQAEQLAGGALDVVVNNAGIVMGGPVEVQDMQAASLMFDTNVYGVHRVTRAALPAMRARGSGHIVNISSQAGRVVFPSGGLYSASKFAVESMSEQLAYELFDHGIDVTIIEPGGFPTEVGQNRAKYTQDLFERVEPVHGNGYPELVAAMQNTRTVRDGPVPPGMPDPVMVPQAILEITSMPAGTRPLRRAVHPKFIPQEEINRVSAEAMVGFLGQGRFGKAVTDINAR